MKTKRRYIKCCLLTVFFSVYMLSCITEYTPNSVELRGVLVVDGIISSDSTCINISQSVGLTELIESVKPVANATLYVACDDGTLWQEVDYKGNGNYTIKTGVLSSAKQYRLHILINGEKYQSEYLYPIITSEIDSISLSKAGQGEPMYTCVSTHDPANQSSYYLWSFKEIWEVRAQFFANAGHLEDWWGGPIIMFDLQTSDNRYYCWGRDSSKTLLLGNANKLTENRLIEERLNKFEPSNDRLMELYYVEVSQNQLRKEAYNYFYNLQKNVEQTGGLYAPMPTDIRGNIQCVTDPDRFVIGYIEVSETTHAERFFSSLEEFYEPIPNNKCKVILDAPDPDTSVPENANYNDYDYLYLSGGDGSSMTYKICVDCRAGGRGTKDRPEFWPNDHY